MRIEDVAELETSIPGVLAVKTLDAARGLAAELIDPRRANAIVCVTAPTWAQRPLLDIAKLSERLSGAAPIHVMPTGEISWELSAALPPKLDVYGGAARIWWPFGDSEPRPYDHPLVFLHEPADGPRAIEEIVDAFTRRGLIATVTHDPGTDLGAVVTGVTSQGAELELAGGGRGFAHASHVTRVRGIDPRRILRVGQAVRVEVGEASRPGDRMRLSLLPFEPDGFERLCDQYSPGMIVVGMVDELRNVGALVELLPGVRGLIHKRNISYEWVSHPEDFLSVGELITVRIDEIDRDSERISLSLRDVPPDAQAEPVASLYPDGPPWLTEADRAAPVPADPGPVAELHFADDDASSVLAPDEGDASAPPAQMADSSASATDEPEAVEALPVSDTSVPAMDEPQPDDASSGEAEALGAVTTEAGNVRDALRDAVTAGERRLSQLRAEAVELRRTMERDLAQARLRVLEFAESDVAAALGSTEAALADVRAEAETLQQRLDVAEEDRRALMAQLRDERRRRSGAEERIGRLREDLQAATARGTALEAELVAGSPEGRFVQEVRRAWERNTTQADREEFPLEEPDVGPGFMESLERVQGVSRERVAEVCAEVACGRAQMRARFEIHPLRAGLGGSDPQLTRGDGAKAWRAALQMGTAAARRLHYWRLPGGRVELAKIVYHDDFSIE